MDFVEEVKKHEELLYLETTETIEREWEVSERKVRPRSQQIGHSGFLTFVRKIN
jgi:tRNA A58 N-methylase Trm61